MFSQNMTSNLLSFLLVLFVADLVLLQQLPPYGNLHPLNFGESQCGPDISRYYQTASHTADQPSTSFEERNRLNQHLVYRDSKFFHRKRWDTGGQLNKLDLFRIARVH